MGDERIWCEGHTACQELKSRGDAMLSCRAVYNNNRVWVCGWVGGWVRVERRNFSRGLVEWTGVVLG